MWPSVVVTILLFWKSTFSKIGIVYLRALVTSFLSVDKFLYDKNFVIEMWPAIKLIFYAELNDDRKEGVTNFQ